MHQRSPRGGRKPGVPLLAACRCFLRGFEAPGVRAVPSVRPLCGESLFQSWRQKNNPFPLQKDPTSVPARLGRPLLLALEQYRSQISPELSLLRDFCSLAVRILAALSRVGLCQEGTWVWGLGTCSESKNPTIFISSTGLLRTHARPTD